jgi:hypothetical protein
MLQWLARTTSKFAPPRRRMGTAEFAMTAPLADVERAIRLADKEAPTPEEEAFLKGFFADHLEPRPGEDPAAHAARLTTPELFKLYRQLRTDIQFSPPVTRAPAPDADRTEAHESVGARVLSERVPAASSHADFVDVDEDYPPAGPEDAPRDSSLSEPNPPGNPGPRARSRAARKPTGKDHGFRGRVGDLVHRHKLIARFLLAAVAIAGASYTMMYLINRQAHRSAGPVRQMQQQTGKAAENISTDPSRATIDNKVRSTPPASPPEKTGR